MPDGWSDLEDKLKKIDGKKQVEAASIPKSPPESASVEEKPRKERKGGFAEYMEKVQNTYKDARSQGPTSFKDKYESSFDNKETLTLHKESTGGTKQFKGFEKRFLKRH
ncbi:MAG: hypothetical protein ABH851_04300 [Methanobacteriota archaeon]